MIDRIETHEGSSVPEMAPREENNVEPSFCYVGAEQAPQMIERRLRHSSGPDLGCEYGFDLDQREFGDDQVSARRLGERLHPFAARLLVIQLRQCTGVEEIARRLTFVPFSGKIGVE